MEEVEKHIQKVKDTYGQPRDGFQDFLKSCTFLQPLMPPTRYLPLCKGYILPSGIYLHDLMIQPYYDARTLEARDSDILVNSYPKTGSTWTQEICYLIMHDGDTEKANSAPLEDRSPFIEIPSVSISTINNMPDPRVLKSNLPYEELPPSFKQGRAKIVYITRNPKDTAVSFYHFMKELSYFQYDADFETFLDLFLAGKVVYSSFADHVLGMWKRRHEDNIFFITYEDLLAEFRSSILKIANFLGKSLSDEQVNKIEQHCLFETMSKNPMTKCSSGSAIILTPNRQFTFMRKGKVGDWKNFFNTETNKKMDEYIERHFHGSGLHFRYDI